MSLRSFFSRKDEEKLTRAETASTSDFNFGYVEVIENTTPESKYGVAGREGVDLCIFTLQNMSYLSEFLSTYPDIKIKVESGLYGYLTFEFKGEPLFTYYHSDGGSVHAYSVEGVAEPNPAYFMHILRQFKSFIKHKDDERRKEVGRILADYNLLSLNC